jgi:hypothetical protein
MKICPKIDKKLVRKIFVKNRNYITKSTPGQLALERVGQLLGGQLLLVGRAVILALGQVFLHVIPRPEIQDFCHLLPLDQLDNYFRQF